MTELKGKNVALVGLGVEGRSAARFAAKQGAHITICDKDDQLVVDKSYDKRLGENYLDRLDDFDLIVRSPGTKPELLKKAKAITSPTQLFLERCPAPIIGVTGTKGKGTTATLIAKMLEAAGNTVHLGGNIGTPMLDLLADINADDHVVLELSSFQLYDVTISPHIAVVLMIEADHLDWHHDMADYVKAKTGITRWQKPDDIVIYHAHNPYSKKVADMSQGRQLAYLSDNAAHITDKHIVIENTTICEVDEVGLIGQHNLENICAALSTVWQITQQPQAFRRAIQDFTGLEHRLEFVRELNNVKYYNDSFSVDPLAAKAAVMSFEEPIVLIAGGYDRGLDFSELAKTIAGSTVRQVILTGQTANAIAGALKTVGFDAVERLDGDMTQVVQQAAKVAQSGEVVLLSPASASFDQYQDYKERGERFKAAVNALARAQSV